MGKLILLCGIILAVVFIVALSPKTQRADAAAAPVTAVEVAQQQPEPKVIASPVPLPTKRPGKEKHDLVASFDRRMALVRNAVEPCRAPTDNATIAACNCVVPILAGHLTEADFADLKKKNRRNNDMLFSAMLSCRSQLHLN